VPAAAAIHYEGSVIGHDWALRIARSYKKYLIKDKKITLSENNTLLNEICSRSAITFFEK